MHPFSALVGFTNERSSFLAFSSMPTFTLMRAITVTFFSTIYLLLSSGIMINRLLKNAHQSRSLRDCPHPRPVR
jgi:hypothetical protein